MDEQHEEHEGANGGAVAAEPTTSKKTPRRRREAAADDGQPEQAAPPPPPPPQRRRAEPTVELSEEREDELEILRGEDRGTLRVRRDLASRDGGSTQTGGCGRIPRSGDPLTAISSRWGGGEYTLTGFDQAGKVVSVTITVPGASKSLTDDDPSMDEPVERTYAPPPAPAWGGGGFGDGPFGPPLPAPPGYGYPAPGGPSGPGWYNRAFNPHARGEVDKLQAEVGDLKRALEIERLNHEKSKGELQTLKEQLRAEAAQRQFDQKFAALQTELARVSAAASGKKDDGAGDKFMNMFLALMQQEQQRRESASASDAARREAEMQRTMAFLENQSRLAAEGKQDPGEMLKAVMALAGQIAEKQSPFEMLKKVAELKKDLLDDDEDDDEDEEEKPVWQQAAEGLLQAMQNQQQTGVQVAAPQQLPGPQPQQQPQGGQMDRNSQVWLSMIDEVFASAAAADNEETAASKLVAWARQNDALAHLGELTTASLDDIIAGIKDKADKIPRFVPGRLREIKVKLEEFAKYAAGPGRKWLEDVQVALRKIG